MEGSVAKTINVDIDEQGNVTVDILGGIDSSCKGIADGFKKLGKVTKDVKNPEFYRTPYQNQVKAVH